MKNNLFKSFNIFLFLTIMFLFVSCKQKQYSKRELFEKFIIKPIPNSVKILNADYSKGTIDSDCIITFDISPKDFDLVLSSRNFKKVEFIECRLPEPFCDWEKSERENYSCDLIQNSQIYELVTNIEHTKVCFMYTNY